MAADTITVTVTEAAQQVTATVTEGGSGSGSATWGSLTGDPSDSASVGSQGEAVMAATTPAAVANAAGLGTADTVTFTTAVLSSGNLGMGAFPVVLGLSGTDFTMQGGLELGRFYGGDFEVLNQGAIYAYSDLDDSGGDYERAALSMDTSGNATLATEAGGAGTAGDINLLSGAGLLFSATDDTYHFDSVAAVLSSNSRFHFNTSCYFGGNSTGNSEVLLQGDGMYLASGAGIHFRTGSAIGGSSTDAEIWRQNGAGQFGFHGLGGNAKIWIHSDDSDASANPTNYEALTLTHPTGGSAAVIATEAAGTGTRADIQLDGANRAAHIADVSTGTDTAYETAINAIIAALESHGIAATS